MIDNTCVFYMVFAHVLTCLTRVSEYMQFYLGFVHLVDNMCTVALVLTRFTMVFHIFGNMSFYMGFVHMIDNMHLSSTRLKQMSFCKISTQTASLQHVFHTLLTSCAFLHWFVYISDMFDITSCNFSSIAYTTVLFHDRASNIAQNPLPPSVGLFAKRTRIPPQCRRHSRSGVRPPAWEAHRNHWKL